MAEATAEPFDRAEFDQLNERVARLEGIVVSTSESLTKLQETVVGAIQLFSRLNDKTKTDSTDVPEVEEPKPEVETPKPKEIIKHNRGHIHLHTTNMKDYIEAREIARGIVVFMEIDSKTNKYTSTLEFGEIPPPPKEPWFVRVFVENKDARRIWMMSVEGNNRSKCLEHIPSLKELVITGTDAQLESFLRDWNIKHKKERLIVRWFGSHFDVPALQKKYPDINIYVAT